MSAARWVPFFPQAGIWSRLERQNARRSPERNRLAGSPTCGCTSSMVIAAPFTLSARSDGLPRRSPMTAGHAGGEGGNPWFKDCKQKATKETKIYPRNTRKTRKFREDSLNPRNPRSRVPPYPCHPPDRGKRSRRIFQKSVDSRPRFQVKAVLHFQNHEGKGKISQQE